MRWIMPPDDFFLEIDAPKLQYVPVLVDEDDSYPIEANTYLIERSNGEWAPGENGDPVIPTLRSRQGMASRLCAFLRFCRHFKRDWRTVTYGIHILGEYQPSLLKGTGSATGKRLTAATVNAYVDEAVVFLLWGSERGHRQPFRVPRRKVRIKPNQSNQLYRHSGGIALQRHGKMQVVSDQLPTLPSIQDVSRWLSSIKIKASVKALIFEFMIRTGARLSEANQLRTTCFPNKSHLGSERWNPRWVHQGWVPVTLRYGVKGGKVEPASMLSIRSRTIEVPIDLAERIWNYKLLVRQTILRRVTRGDRSKDKSDSRLWLGEKKGQPVSNSMLYKAWVGAPHCPHGWNPHDGRHFFAVERICESTHLLMRQNGVDNPENISIGWLHGLMAGQIRLILSPLLGHVSEETTMRYLRCAHRRLIEDIGHPVSDWNNFIDTDLTDSPA